MTDARRKYRHADRPHLEAAIRNLESLLDRLGDAYHPSAGVQRREVLKDLQRARRALGRRQPA